MIEIGPPRAHWISRALVLEFECSSGTRDAGRAPQARVSRCRRCRARGTALWPDLGYFDDQTCRLEPIEDRFGPKMLPMSPE